MSKEIQEEESLNGYVLHKNTFSTSYIYIIMH